MSMGDAVDLFDYWREHPPVHLILGAVHISSNARSAPSHEPSFEAQGKRSPTEAEAFQQISAIQQFAGSALGTPEQMPPHLAELADWAEEMASKMKLN